MRPTSSLPKVSVITSLSYDHMAVLGNTLAQIAGEKAGIIKQGVPVVSAPQTEEALEVLERTANEKNCPFILVGRDVKFERLDVIIGWTGIPAVIIFRISSISVKIPLLGSHQVENAATAYTALKTSGIEISDEAIQKGFSRVKWHARFELLRRQPPVIIDSAHNRDSACRAARNTR